MKRKTQKEEVYFNKPRVNEAYLKVLKNKHRATAFKGMTTIEILKEIRKN